MTNCCYQSSDRILRTKRNLFLIKTKEERWTHVAHRGYFSCLSKTVFTRSTKLPPIHKYYKGMCYSQIYALEESIDIFLMFISCFIFRCFLSIHFYFLAQWCTLKFEYSFEWIVWDFLLNINKNIHVHCNDYPISLKIRKQCSLAATVFPLTGLWVLLKWGFYEIKK